MNNKLKSCPFCGSCNIGVFKKNNGTLYVSLIGQRVTRHTHTVRCKNCFARGGTSGGLVLKNKLLSYPKSVAKDITTDEALEEEAIRLWNTRIYE